MRNQGLCCRNNLGNTEGAREIFVVLNNYIGVRNNSKSLSEKSVAAVRLTFLCYINEIDTSGITKEKIFLRRLD